MFRKAREEKANPNGFLFKALLLAIIIMYAAGFRIANLRHMRADEVPWSPVIHGQYE